MPFSLEASPQFENDYRKLCRKNQPLKTAVDNKVNQICQTAETNPDHYKPLRGRLAGVRRVHVESSFVLLFEILKEKRQSGSFVWRITTKRTKNAVDIPTYSKARK